MCQEWTRQSTPTSTPHMRDSSIVQEPSPALTASSHPSSPLDPEEAREQLLAVGEEVNQRAGTPTRTTHPPPHPPTAENQVSLNRRSLHWMGDKCFYLDRTRLIFQLGKNSFFFAHHFIRIFKHTDKLKE